MEAKRNESIKKLIKSGTKKYIIISTILFSLCTCINIGVSLLIKNGIDDIGSLKNRFFLFFILLLLAYLLKMLTLKYQYNFAYRYKVEKNKDLYDEVFKMKYLKLIDKEPTYIAERIHMAVETLYTFYGNVIPNLIVNILGILIILGLVVTTNKIIALLLFLILILKYFGYKKINHKLSMRSMKLQKISASNFKDIFSIISNTDYIKQLDRSDKLRNLLSKNIVNIQKEVCNVSKYGEYVSSTLEFLLNIVQNIIYIYSLYLVAINSMTLSEFVFISLLSILYFKFAGSLIGLNINMRDYKGAVTFIEKEIFDLQESDGTKIIESIDNIDLNINDFGFDKVLVKGGHCTIKKGDIVGISADSGAGKSSIIKGIMKFYNVDEIKVNNININDIKNQCIRSKIQYISQNIPIVPGTIEDNILLGNENSQSMLEKIKEVPFMDKFAKLDNGFKTIILENGMNLSGGDKQKISFARVLLDLSEVLILDETTNSIDKKTAIEILDYVLNEYKDKIVILISHDNYVLNYCNKVIAIKDNIISECEEVNEVIGWKN